MLRLSSLLLVILLLFFSNFAQAQASEESFTRQRFIREQQIKGHYTAEEALLYNYLAIKDPTKLPAEIHFLPNERQLNATSIFLQVFQGLKQGRFSPDVAAQFSPLPAAKGSIEDEEERPKIESSGGYIDSSIYPLRVHWTKEAYRNIAYDVLEYAEYAWDVETKAIGFRAPLRDGGEAGSYNLDIYVDSSAGGACGYTKPVDWYYDTPITDCYTYIVIATEEPTCGGISTLDTTVAHELNHAIQAAYDCLEPHSFWENTATYIMDLVYPQRNDFIYYLPSFQNFPHFPYDYFDSSSTYQYGAMLSLAFLDDYYGNNDGTFISDIWEDCEQEEYDNTANYIDAITLNIDYQKPGSTFDDFLTLFTEWRYFIGPNDDGHHLSYASDLVYCNPTIEDSCQVAIDSSAYITQNAPMANGTNKFKMAAMSSSYVEINLEKGLAGDLVISFTSAKGRWAASAFCSRGVGTTFASSIFPLPMDELKQTGQVTIELRDFEKCVLAVTNLGAETNKPTDPTSLDLIYQYNYSVALRADELPPPKVTSISANMLSCSGRQNIVLEGENFFWGMQVVIGGVAANIKEFSATRVVIVTPPLAESGEYALAISNPDGSIAEVEKVIYSGETCQCDCDVYVTCDADCPCDIDCLMCSCDVDTACSQDCPCDPECSGASAKGTAKGGCNCNSASRTGQYPDFIGFLCFLFLLVGFMSRRWEV